MKGMDWRRRLRKASEVLVFIIASACAPVQPPDLQLADIQFGEVRAFETELRVGVRIENDNPRPLEITGASYRIYVNDVYLGKGMSSQSVSVPALGSAVQTVKIEISNITLLPKVQQLLNTEGFAYRIEGRLYREGLLSSVPVNEAGRFLIEK